MDLSKIYKKRDEWVHKGQFGTLLVVAGCRDLTGSPIFNAMAALRAGCDLVMVVSPERSADVAASYSPDILTSPLPGDFLRNEHIPTITSLAEESTAVVIGGGLGRSEEIFAVIRQILGKIEKPVVIDAEALRALGSHLEVISGKSAILTPHANEMLALSGQKVGENLETRKKVAQEFAKKFKTTLLLKGHVDVVASGDKVYLNQTGSPLMTKGGFGDTLAGICGGLLARGIEPFETACAAAYINGKAGELACREKGEAVLASDIFDFIPKVISR